MSCPSAAVNAAR